MKKKKCVCKIILFLFLFFSRKTVALTIEVWWLFMGQLIVPTLYYYAPCIRRSALANNIILFCGVLKQTR